jgi:two-component system chemotaxis sensor kinase CheA
LSPLSVDEVGENFEYLFDHEYRLSFIEPLAIEAVEEVVSVASEKPRTAAAKGSSGATDATSVKSTIRIDTFKLDELFDSVGELVIAQNFIAQNEKIRLIEDESISRTIETLSKITKRIQDRVMSLRMVAIRDTFDKMKRVVRDTSKKTGKALHLNVLGEETEIDKTMIDSLSDPMIHIIRIAIDHGLEADADERIAAGKKVEGNITIRAYHKSGSIVISVSDDGRGINKEKVFRKAIERGIIAGDENLTDSQIFGLIMQPGFSTADTISDLSGRGVGLDVVKTSIEKLRGKIEIESKEGEGTTFSMVLPLTLAIIDGMLVQTAGEIYIIPTLSVVESFRPEQEIVHAIKGQGEFVSMRGQHIPVIRLSDVFDLNAKRIEPWEGILVCVETEAGRIAIMVDELVGRQQVVIKPLGKSLAKLREITGGAILGSGDIALILNVDELRPLIEAAHGGN